MKRCIALFVHQPLCSTQCINGVMRALESNYRFKLFGKGDLEDSFFDDVDLVLYPGGIGDSDRFDTIAKRHQKVLKTYLQNGGRYLGICMGAYWADKDYFNLLDGIRVQQYIKQPGTDTRRPHPKAIEINWLGNLEKMYFNDGCTFLGDNLDVVATYPTGYPAAIIQNKIGLIGVHPESEKFWFDDIKYMKRHWHGGKHSTLLLDFVNKLMEIK